MDQHAGEKDADDNKSQDSADQQREDDAPAAAGYKAAAPLLKEVTAGSDESSSPAAALFAHPCSLLQLLLRSCAGCLGLHGHDPKPVAAPDDSSAAEEGEGGDKANVSGSVNVPPFVFLYAR